MLKLKAILEEKGISQRKLAGLLAVSPAVITNLVNHGLLIKTGTEQFKTRLTEVLKTLGISTALSELLKEESADAPTPADVSPNNRLYFQPLKNIFHSLATRSPTKCGRQRKSFPHPMYVMCAKRCFKPRVLAALWR